MFCQTGFDQWLTTIMHHLSPLSKPQATVLALWSFGMVLARSCALSAGSHLLAKGVQRQGKTARQQLRALYRPSARRWGPVLSPWRSVWSLGVCHSRGVGGAAGQAQTCLAARMAAAGTTA